MQKKYLHNNNNNKRLWIEQIQFCSKRMESHHAQSTIDKTALEPLSLACLQVISLLYQLVAQEEAVHTKTM